MQETNRRKRPPAGRTEPDRSFSGWVRRAAPNGEEDHGSPSAEADPGEPSKARENGYQAINGAYRLIDEYMRQGQKMAEDLWLPAENGERGEVAFEAPMRFMRAMGDMTMAWVEVMQQWTTNVQPSSPGVAGPFTAGRPAPQRAQQGAPAPAPARTESTQSLRVSVKAAGPVEVSVHITEPSDVARLVAGELRPFSGEAPPIRTVSVEHGPGEAPVLRIVVPEGQPAGTYNGLLVAEGTHQPRGTICLIVS